MCPSLQRSHFFWAEGVVGEEENNEILKKKTTKKTGQFVRGQAHISTFPVSQVSRPGSVSVHFSHTKARASHSSLSIVSPGGGSFAPR